MSTLFKSLCVSILVTLITCLSCAQIKESYQVATNKSLEDIIDRKYYIDSTEQVKVIFIYKLDSLGEIHSAHIRWSKNLKNDYNTAYYICSEIEKYIKLPQVAKKNKEHFLIDGYLLYRYPYFSKKESSVRSRE